MTTELDKTKSLNYCLVEQRRLYDNILTTIEGLRTKALALLAGEIALVTFLFDSDFKNFFTQDTPVYGFVFFGIGLCLLIVAAAFFLMVISSISFSHPPTSDDIKYLEKRYYKDSDSFLEKMVENYDSCIISIIKIANSRAKKFMYGVYCFSGGIAITILIKYLSTLIDLGG
jgi:hypothetical protein